MNKEESIQRIIKEKPHSYEFGKTGNRFKIYYDFPEELHLHIEKLKNLQLLEVKE